MPQRSEAKATDIHSRLIRVYPEVPQWWYAIVFLVSFALAFAALIIYVPEAPKWVRYSKKKLTLALILRDGIIFSSAPSCWYSNSDNEQ
jgi:hypothetical protein